MSIRRTSELPSTIDGCVLTGVVIPNRRAMSAIVEKPTSCPSFAATVLIEKANAVRSVTDPLKRRESLRGLQPSMVTGSSTTVSSGFFPASSAARYTNSLNADPGWRTACVARL